MNAPQTGRIELPRHLATELLHWAMVNAGGEAVGLILQQPDGRLLLEPAAREAAAGTTYAVVRAVPGNELRPSDRDIETWRGRTGLFLTVALGTRGVLQLGGWSLAAGKIEPLEIGITETP